ncbi:hypothetical protein F5B22DRAFT_626390 [Xylaria bambusicola]|uniref:uncharacterized protein n=1 Tax=Xylaria bambusicola TaxID=326684 RepID=UPI0020089AE0|nr:uncharacterized protein F5B22DRAFT_626390 [Xylaria bambusicola]KAI0505808.1 hypothetical protein F5B22DRAFT_626390 [Xylaria bambusicola]
MAFTARISKFRYYSVSMRFLYFVSVGLLSSIAEGLNIFERQTDVCRWALDPDDCICMNSVNGSNMKDPTSICCANMGLKTTNLKCHVSHDFRQTFKDCCKWLALESVIGHCR